MLRSRPILQVYADVVSRQLQVANGKQNAAEQINMVLQAKMRAGAQPPWTWNH